MLRMFADRARLEQRFRAESVARRDRRLREESLAIAPGSLVAYGQPAVANV